MPLNTPASRKIVVDRSRTDVQAQLPTSNPFFRGSFLGALITGFAGRVYDFYLDLNKLAQEMFPDTATGTHLERWGSYKSITRNAATKASGSITATGTATTVIPSATALQSADGNQYVTTAAGTITAQTLSVSGITRSGGTATVTTASEHALAPGVEVTISGANETAYNGTVTIESVPSATTFTYTVTGAPTTPATGTIVADVTTASLPIESVEFGQTQNLSVGAAVTFSSPISGVDNTAYVQFSEVAGGTNIESDTDLRARVIDRYQNPVALFNSAAIEAKAKEVAGVTRVFVQEATPDAGQVTIYFTRDNDASIIPAASEVTAVKNKILTIKPAHVEDSDVIVAAPVAVPVDFTFTSLSPNTSTMQDAIEANLDALFEEQTTVGSDMQDFAYESTIFRTVDATGATVIDFTLSAPSGDVSISTGEIPTLGTITFP